ncbi:MAG: CPP1-like family protein [Cylindrospermopsis raciborskii]|uniref:CPP1-like family protein n=1 Tax=Cylindrospermopsis raciborskii TaxID=77022 RepID=UPI003D13A2CC
MNDLPRQKLKEIIIQHGLTLCDDPKRCEAFLRDYCGECRREIFILISALKQDVAKDLLNSSNIPLEFLISKLISKMQNELGLTEEAGRYAVESWAQALDKMPSPQTQQGIQQILEELRSFIDKQTWKNWGSPPQIQQPEIKQTKDNSNQTIKLDLNNTDAYNNREIWKIKLPEGIRFPEIRMPFLQEQIVNSSNYSPSGSQENSDEPSLSDTLWPTVYYFGLSATSLLLKNSAAQFYTLIAGFVLCIYFLNSIDIMESLISRRVFKFLWAILLTLEILVVGLIIGELIAAQMHFTSYGVISPTPFSTVLTLILMWFISSFFHFILLT